MQRRGESEQPIKGRRTTRPKVRKVSSALVPGADPQKQIARLMQDRDEAQQQQAATAEILRLISNSPTDTQPVFEAIVKAG